MRFRLDRYAACTATLVIFLALVVFLNDFGHFDTDIKPEVYLAPWNMVGRYLSSWTSSPYLGSANFNVGLVPVLLVLSVLRGVGMSPEWTFKVFHFFLWLVAAWGANRLTRALVPRASRWIPLAAGVFYLANPYTIAAGNTLAIALPMAFLPWLLLTYVRALGAPRSWAWPAAFGLAFFAMSGMNVAVVPLFQLFALVPIAVVARWHGHRTWRQIFGVTAKCALFVILVSLYWLVPGVAALSAGTQVVDTSETLTGISKVSSLTEVLRGLGLWPLYGHDSNGPWVPQNAAYITSPWVILLTALWPIAALAGLRRARSGLRRALVLMIAMAALVMVGLFPGQNASRSPLGWIIQGILSIPALAAFRTTNKIGALLALAFALALAISLPYAISRVRERSFLIPVALTLSTVAVAAWILPALDNGLYISRMDIPGYWKKAAKTADEADPNSTTLLLPGQTRPTYRWTVQRPDDLTNSLMKHNAVIPETSPNASAPGANFLAALDDTVQEGTVSGPYVSTFARYLGADNILLRHDTVWENDGGARPSVMDALFASDNGLNGIANFGKPGQNVLSPTVAPSGINEALDSPVQLYAVRGARSAVRVESLKNQLIVAGDGWSIPEMTSANLLASDPAIRYAQDLNSSQVSSALSQGAGFVLTDTNARRNVIPQRLTSGEGALLSSSDSLSESRTLGSDPSNETVLLRSGTLVTASTSGGTFFGMPYAIPENAFDGNPATSWRFGDFRRAVGQTLTLTMPAPQKLGDITIAQPNLGPVKLNKVTMTANGKSVSTIVPSTGSDVFHMGGVTASKVTVKIDSIRGNGFNLVGISELGLPGQKAERAAQTPLTLTNLYNSLGAKARGQFDKAPLDVLLSRVQNTPDPADDSEIALRRVVSMPDTRSYDVQANVRAQSGSAESMYDLAAGYDPSIKATSSDFYFHRASARASMAADGSSSTGWMPGGYDPLYQWWQLQTSARDISSVRVTQTHGDRAASATRYATKVGIFVDGKKVATSEVAKEGATTISLPAGTHGSKVRMEIEAVSGKRGSAPSKFTNIDTGVSMKTTTPGPFDSGSKNRCLRVATVDGSGIPMRLTSSSAAGQRDQGTTWTSCTPITLNAGERRIEQVPGFVIDSMNFSDRSAKTQPVPSQPSFRVSENSPSHERIDVAATTSPTAVVVGQSFDSRWNASVDGHSLGNPTTIDGFSTGWILPAGPARTIDIRFGPQRAAYVALAISILTILAALALVVLAFRRGGLAPQRPHRRERWERERALAKADTPSSRNLRDGVLVALATFGLGLPGLVAAVAAVVLYRRRLLSPERVMALGIALISVGMVLFCIINLHPGHVDADAVSSSLWPHYLCGAGLVLALSSLMRRTGLGDRTLFGRRQLRRSSEGLSAAGLSHARGSSQSRRNGDDENHRDGQRRGVSLSRFRGRGAGDNDAARPVGGGSSPIRMHDDPGGDSTE